ncbi:TetR/AcrR family transcriptional regulator [Plantactinospora sp. WMMB334]|uniref:TetR/AcrR family transcriptional regulator n=1 Tax=Plantactinospora sp. WMMB334 TaxID=3404119 RepID=UPI003B93A49B
MTVRDRKRVRTRQALVVAAVDLFERHGYERTTIADIAAAAEIGTRTFFSYFATKEEILFPETDARLRAAIEVIEERRPGDRPATVLLRAWERADEVDEDDLADGLATLRHRLINEVPAVRGRALQFYCDAQIEIARRLAETFPDELDEVSATALTGAFAGAVGGALYVLLREPDRAMDPAARRDMVRRAVRTALAPWLERAHQAAE